MKVYGDVRRRKRGRETGGKVAVFGTMKRQGKVYTVILNDTKLKILLPIIKGQQIR